MADPITDPTYRYATQRYDLDGSTIDFYFNFSDGYISTDYIRAYYYNTISLVTTEIDRSLIEFVGVGQVRIPDAALQPVTNKLILKRWTEKEYPLCDFTDDSLINEANLDKNARQAVHDIAEMIDYLADLNEKWESLNKTVLELLQIINDKLAILEDLIALLENLKFTDLKDTPNSLVAGGIPQVNHAGTALVWRTAAEIVSEGGGGVITFTGLTDTPNSYTGQNNKIVSVSGSSLVFKTVAQAVADEGVTFGIPEAPNDGNEYVRKNQAWAQKTNLIGEAPTDGQQYARQNGAWSVVEGGGSGGATKFIDLDDTPNNYNIGSNEFSNGVLVAGNDKIMYYGAGKFQQQYVKGSYTSRNYSADYGSSIIMPGTMISSTMGNLSESGTNRNNIILGLLGTKNLPGTSGDENRSTILLGTGFNSSPMLSGVYPGLIGWIANDYYGGTQQAEAYSNNKTIISLKGKTLGDMEPVALSLSLDESIDSFEMTKLTLVGQTGVGVGAALIKGYAYSFNSLLEFDASNQTSFPGKTNIWRFEAILKYNMGGSNPGSPGTTPSIKIINQDWRDIYGESSTVTAPTFVEDNIIDPERPNLNKGRFQIQVYDAGTTPVYWKVDMEISVFNAINSML